MKLKEYWSKLKYWKRGLFLGAISGILLNLYVFFFNGQSYLFKGIASWQALPNIIPLSIHAILFSTTITSQLVISSAIFITIWYAFLGSLMGLIYNFLKNKFPSKYKSVFSVVTIIFIFLILLTNFIVIMWLLAKAA